MTQYGKIFQIVILKIEGLQAEVQKQNYLQYTPWPKTGLHASTADCKPGFVQIVYDCSG